MTRTLGSVWRDLYALFSSDPEPLGAPVPALAGLVSAVHLGEPAPGELVTPVSLTVTPAQVDAEYYRLMVRVYSSVAHHVAQGWSALVAAMDAAETLMGTTSEFERGVWTIIPAPSLDAVIAEIEVQAGRMDF